MVVIIIMTTDGSTEQKYDNGGKYGGGNIDTSCGTDTIVVMMITYNSW